jgi:N-acyl-D-aspartate/D-glutamate deacylase
MLDLVLRNGLVVDGSGRSPVRTDLGIAHGRVVRVGPVEDAARRRLDLDGLVVVPGFIDLHTHYDAQVFWDPMLTPSPSHGVTTVISGNCGLTLAPMRPADRDFAVGLLSNVEGIPAEAIAAGVDFGWETYPELLDRLEATPLGVNLGLMVGHSALRRHAMGPRASTAAATDEQLDAMCGVLAEALSAGGFGFSTATAPTHRDGDGCPSPPNFAEAREFVELSRVCGSREGTSLEFIARTSQQGFDEDDRALMARMSSAADRVLNWNTPVVSKEDPTLHVRQLDACRLDADSAVCIVPMMLSQNNPLFYDLRRGYVHRTLPGWGWLFELDLPERAEALKDPGVRERLRRGVEGPDASSTAIRMRRWGHYEVMDVGPPAMAGLKGRSVADIARTRGTDECTTWMDLLVESGFDIGFAIAYYPGEDEWVTETRRAMLSDPRVLVGASDGGAHMDMLVGGSSALRTLIEWVYRRRAFTLEHMVHLLTDVPARLYGLRGRGRLAEGYAADLLVLDPGRVDVSPMWVQRDLPCGSPRLMSSATGVERVMVGGTEVYVHDRPTGALPGRLLRSGRDSATVTSGDWVRWIGRAA